MSSAALKRIKASRGTGRGGRLFRPEPQAPPGSSADDVPVHLETDLDETQGEEGVSQEEALKESKKWKGRFQDHPRVISQAMVIWEHKQEQGLSMAPIIEKDGVRSLGKWMDDGTAVLGRLTQILPGAGGN